MKSTLDIPPSSCFFITGFMGVGKSYWARQMAGVLQIKSYDLDDCIEKEYNLSISAIFEQGGEALFRSYESKVLQQLLSQAHRPAIIALGGGTLIARENQLMIQSEGPLICLKHHKQFPDVVVETQVRPLWDDSKLEVLYDERKEGYSMAEAMITPDGRTVETVVNEMINVWENHGSRS